MEFLACCSSTSAQVHKVRVKRPTEVHIYSYAFTYYTKQIKERAIGTSISFLIKCFIVSGVDKKLLILFYLCFVVFNNVLYTKPSVSSQGLSIEKNKYLPQ